MPVLSSQNIVYRIGHTRISGDDEYDELGLLDFGSKCESAPVFFGESGRADLRQIGQYVWSLWKSQYGQKLRVVLMVCRSIRRPAAGRGPFFGSFVNHFHDGLAPSRGNRLYSGKAIQ
jgi:hypothetical protein